MTAGGGDRCVQADEELALSGNEKALAAAGKGAAKGEVALLDREVSEPALLSGCR
jgi:hypothetical protein